MPYYLESRFKQTDMIQSVQRGILNPKNTYGEDKIDSMIATKIWADIGEVKQ